MIELIDLNVTSRKLLNLITIYYENDVHTFNQSVTYIQHLELRAIAHYDMPWQLNDVRSMRSTLLSFKVDFIDIENPQVKSAAKCNCFDQIFQNLYYNENFVAYSGIGFSNNLTFCHLICINFSIYLVCLLIDQPFVFWLISVLIWWEESYSAQQA